MDKTAGHATIDVTQKQGREVVGESRADTGFESVEDIAGSVTVSLKRTINLKDFNSIAIGVSVSLPLDPGKRAEAQAHVDDALAQAEKIAGKKIADIKAKVPGAS